MAYIETHPKETLCSFCSSIEFDFLRVPTVGQLRHLLAGHDITGQFPFKRNLDRSPLQWELGSMNRIQQSADLCDLCRVISEVFRHFQQAGEDLTSNMTCTALLRFRGTFKPVSISTISPTVLKYMGFEQSEDLSFSFRSLTIQWSDTAADSQTFWLRIVWANYCLHVYDPQYSQSALALFNDEKISDDRLLLSGRIASPHVDLEMLRMWMEQCISKHGENCAATSTSRFVVLNSTRCAETNYIL